MATDNKYDRQLRLWGASGQKALASTTVVLIRASAAGTETLKNLVLPGVGGFFIIDELQGDEHAYTSNFFLSSDTSRSPADVAAELLQELNPDVKGDSQAVENLAAVDYRALLSALDRPLVIGADLEPPLLLSIADTCESLRIPLIAVDSYGLIGSVRLQTPPVSLVDPKPRDSKPDLRLVTRFDGLTKLAAGIPWSSLESHEHKHVPYPLILMATADDWKASHGGQLPSSFADKQAFCEAIVARSRDFNEELNFQEAKTNAYLAYTESELDADHLQALRTAAKEAGDAKLMALLHALDQFMAKHQRAPLHGTIPDMTASTALYVELQSVYRQQAMQDRQELRAMVDQALVDDELLTTFCQNVFFLDLYEPRSIGQEWSGDVPEDVKEDLSMATMEGTEQDEQLGLLWGLGLAACRRFYAKHGRYPGTEEDWQGDIAPLQALLLEQAARYGLSDNELALSTLLKSSDYAAELTRYGAAEVHPIASIVGGVASQEAVKLITGQYTPLDHTFIYNGISSIGGVYRF